MLQIIFIVAAILLAGLGMSWAYGNYQKRGVTIVGLIIFAATVALIFVGDQIRPTHETPIGLDIAILFVTTVCIGTATTKAGSSGKGFAARGLLSVVAGVVAVILCSFAAYVLWIWWS